VCPPIKHGPLHINPYTTLTREQWAHLKGKLEALVNKAEDVLAVYFLPPEAVGRTWRIGHEGLKRLEDPDFV
jgi:CRISPR-associated protein Cas2